MRSPALARETSHRIATLCRDMSKGSHASPSQPRITVPVLAILSALLENPSEEIYGLEFVRASGLRSGTIYPALSRLEQAGWLESRWEDIDPSTEKRPRRRLYRLTGQGQIAAREILERHMRQLGEGQARRSTAERSFA